jgi:hypothetical protein
MKRIYSARGKLIRVEISGSAFSACHGRHYGKGVFPDKNCENCNACVVRRVNLSAVCVSCGKAQCDRCSALVSRVLRGSKSSASAAELAVFDLADGMDHECPICSGLLCDECYEETCKVLRLLLASPAEGAVTTAGTDVSEAFAPLSIDP